MCAGSGSACRDGSARDGERRRQRHVVRLVELDLLARGVGDRHDPIGAGRRRGGGRHPHGGGGAGARGRAPRSTSPSSHTPSAERKKRMTNGPAAAGPAFRTVWLITIGRPAWTAAGGPSAVIRMSGRCAVRAGGAGSMV